MPRNEFYCQCKLRRPFKPLINVRDHSAMLVTPLDGSTPYEEIVSWIPSSIAKSGNVVRLKDFAGDKEWSEGWTVMTVGDKRPGDLVEAKASDFKNQRRVSDRIKKRKSKKDR